MSEKNLKVGARVDITGKDLQGTVAYVGMTSFAVGKWVGVVLDEAKGKNNGSIKGQSYFQCEENYGMFVRPTQLRVIGAAPDSSKKSSSEDVSVTPTAQPTRARLSGSRTSLSSSRQSLLGSRTQLTTSLGGGERMPSNTNIARKSLAPTQAKDTSNTSLAASAGDGAGSTSSGIGTTPGNNGGSHASSKRASFVETGFLEILKPQFTPSQPMRSPSFTAPPNAAVSGAVSSAEDKAALQEAQKANAELQTQIADITEKLETLKQRRNEDKERLREFDKMKIQFEQMQEFRTKIMAAQASLQKELQRAKQETKDAIEARERHAQEMADLADNVEMITLDKEMAEEKADTLQLELESYKERIEELQVDLELLRSEMQNKSESIGNNAGEGNGGGMSAYEFKQLEQQNLRLKETLVRLRDLSAHDKHDIQKLTKELETKRSEVAELERTKEKLSTKIDELEATVADLQKLEQEKHVLRQKLAIAEDESDQRVLELHTDLNELKDKLQAQDNAIRQAEKEKTLLIDELQHQNTRLTEQIQEAHATEMKLSAQIQELKDQYNYRNTSLQEHVNSLESIKTELNLTTEKRHELERRLQHAQDEKESLTSALEEASDRIHMLERHAREQETKLETTLQALERSQRENNVLSERLGADSSSTAPGKKSLQFEMECDEDEASFSEGGKPNQMWVEARSVYIQLKSLVDSLKVGHDDDSGLNSDISLDLESMDNTISSSGRTDCSEAVEFRQGMLSAMSDELTRLLLNLDAGNFKKMLDQTRNLVLEQEDEIKRSHQLIQQLEAKVTVTDVELQNVKEERDQARGDLGDNTNRDELLTKAQKERDAAMERRTKAEVELAKTRVELMQANSQLLESIQQKVELSQQLEQWQMDMQELIDEQMRSKMINNRRSNDEITPPSRTGSAAANLAKRVSSYKLWSLFQR